MSQSTITAKLAFARNCVNGAARASLAGERRLAAELRASAREALAGLGAAAAPQELNPHRSQTQAIAAVMLQALH
jgi:hypothetical protein